MQEGKATGARERNKKLGKKKFMNKLIKVWKIVYMSYTYYEILHAIPCNQRHLSNGAKWDFFKYFSCNVIVAVALDCDQFNKHKTFIFRLWESFLGNFNDNFA